MTRQRESTGEMIWESPGGPELAFGFRLGRRASGVVIGLLLAVVYSLVANTIDALVMRDVPLRVDWPAVWVGLALAGLGGAVLGALTAWPEAGWLGSLVGAAGYVAWSFIQSYLKLQAATLIFLPLFLPLVMMSLPLAVFLRWSAGRQEHLQDQPGLARWRAQAWLVIMVLAVGAFAGSWAQMPASSQEAMRRVHRVLSVTLAEPAGTPLPAAFQALPALRNHADSPYELELRSASPGGNQVDVRVLFADGYRISCTTDLEASWLLCREGDAGLFGDAASNPTDER